MRIDDVGVGNDNVGAPIAVEIRDGGADAHAVRTYATQRNVGVRAPLQAFAVAVLEPRVGAQHVEIPVTVDVDHPVWCNRAVDGWSDVMPPPRLPRVVLWNLEP